MTLAEQARHGRVLPVEVRPEQQAAMAAGLERLVAPKAKPREDFSTVDTSASFRPKGVFESESFAKWPGPSAPQRGDPGRRPRRCDGHRAAGAGAQARGTPGPWG
ncbi:unnamed protein product [Effrenium voratum]|uniref:Uncharacterized protein n=1 Tax=Effrenium voratum TaxID=2562239 RepID=A0AA36IMN2_9DINO|nr:unnamed protein product [Effrenium voratum]